MNDAATIEHLLVEDIVSDGVSVCSSVRRKTTAEKSPEKRYIILLFLDQRQWWNIFGVWPERY